MNKTVSRSLAIVMLFGVLSPRLGAQSLLDQIESAVSTGSVAVSLRSRLETVEQDNPLKDATAATLRTRLTLQTGEANGFSGLLEFDDVSVIGADHYDSLVNDRYRGAYSVVADPVGSEVNQAYLRFSPDESQSITLGMQRVNHAAQRFVGSVAWRQNEQTLDALSYSWQSAKFSLDYSYFWNVNRIFGSSKTSVQAENLRSDSHAAYGSYESSIGTIAGFVYDLDFDRASALSSLTYGLSYANVFAGFEVSGSIARQSDSGSNLASYSANYVAADIAYDFGSVKLLLGHESLGSDGGNASFQTPLATLHKWQGWTDLFLSTPAGGIDDSYLNLSGSLAGIRLSAGLHDFSSNHGSTDYGVEWDMIAAYSIRPNLNIELKYASYDSDGYAVDTDKFWLSMSLAF